MNPNKTAPHGLILEKMNQDWRAESAVSLAKKLRESRRTVVFLALSAIAGWVGLIISITTK